MSFFTRWGRLFRGRLFSLFGYFIKKWEFSFSRINKDVKTAFLWQPMSFGVKHRKSWKFTGHHSRFSAFFKLKFFPIFLYFVGFCQNSCGWTSTAAAAAIVADWYGVNIVSDLAPKFFFPSAWLYNYKNILKVEFLIFLFFWGLVLNYCFK